MLSPRTFLEPSASRRARTSARVSRFMRSTARRMYAARDSFRAAAQRPLASSRSSGSFREIAPISHLLREYVRRIRVHDISDPGSGLALRHPYESRRGSDCRSEEERHNSPAATPAEAADRPREAPLVGGAEGLGGVLDQRDLVAGADLDDGGHIRGWP